MSIDGDYQDVLRIVSAWPPEQRASLAHDVLRTLKTPTGHQRRRTLDRALGLGRGEGPPPSDEQVKRWMDEHRREKYGQ